MFLSDFPPLPPLGSQSWISYFDVAGVRLVLYQRDLG